MRFTITDLFNIVLENVIREIKLEFQEGITIQDMAISLLVYADDIVLNIDGGFAR